MYIVCHLVQGFEKMFKIRHKKWKLKKKKKYITDLNEKFGTKIAEKMF